VRLVRTFVQTVEAIITWRHPSHRRRGFIFCHRMGLKEHTNAWANTSFFFCYNNIGRDLYYLREFITRSVSQRHSASIGHAKWLLRAPACVSKPYLPCMRTGFSRMSLAGSGKDTHTVKSVWIPDALTVHGASSSSHALDGYSYSDIEPISLHALWLQHES